jgi:hypothetical protein
MSESRGKVTLIFYSLDAGWLLGTEPLLNVLAALAQRSTFTHVELAIGEAPGARGAMANVLRIFNGEHVELAERTGTNPNFSYVQLSCSRESEQRMLRWAQRQVARRVPFSQLGMLRSVLWPRQTHCESFFCAELVAACLREGGLLSAHSNPGVATPAALYRLFHRAGAASGNPYVIRRVAHAREQQLAQATREQAAAERERVCAAASKPCAAFQPINPTWSL